MSKERPEIGDVWVNNTTGLKIYIVYVGVNYFDVIEEGSVLLKTSTIHYDRTEFKRKYTFSNKSFFKNRNLFEQNKKNVRKITMTFDELVDSYMKCGAAILFLKEKNPKISNENIMKVVTFVLKSFCEE